MSTDSTSRRRTFAALLVAALVVGAGCSGAVPGLGGGGGGDDAPAAADVVPAQADFVASVDVTGLMTDQTLNELANSTLDEESEEVEDTGDARESFQEETGLDPAKLHRAVVFMQTDEEAEYAGVVLETDWATEDVVAAIENDSETEVEETTYGEKTVYRPAEDSGSEDGWLAVLDDGRYAAGSEDAVKDAIDVANGDADSLDGDLREAFENTSEDSYLRFASTVPQDEVPADEMGGGQFDTSSFNQVEIVAGEHAVEDGNVSVTLNMEVASTSDAEDIMNTLDGALRLYTANLGDETMRAVLEDISVSQDGTTVTVHAESPSEELQALLEQFADESTGLTGTAA